MTGEFEIISDILSATHPLCSAEEALQFGIVDRVLEKRPKSESV